jgi:hypothetical protein
MATTPYVRIPYASEQDRYTGRAYTAQQLALMQRRDASESAYASDRAQRMSDRWSGFGGLVTETLGDLRQSRELGEAQALEQARYDEEQARLKRIEDEGNRRFGVEEDWRQDQAQDDKEYREFQRLNDMPLDAPFNERQRYLWNKFGGGSLRTEGGGTTAPPASPRDANVSLGPNVFRPPPEQHRGSVFGGLFQPPGGETLAEVAQRPRDTETGVQLGISPDELFSATAPVPTGPPLSYYRPQTAAEAQAGADRARDEERYQAQEAARTAALGVSADDRRTATERYNEEIVWRDAASAIELAGDKPLPAEVTAAIAALSARRNEGVDRDQAIADLYERWTGWSAAYPGLKLEDVQDVVRALWPLPGAGNQYQWDALGGQNVAGTGVLTPGATDDLAVATYLFQQRDGEFDTLEAALAAVRALREEEEGVTVPGPRQTALRPGPPARLEAPLVRGRSASGRFAWVPDPNWVAPPATPRSEYRRPGRN